MSAQKIDEVMQNIKFTSQKLRAFARFDSNPNVKKLLFEAAHHLDVGVAELEYVTTNATVSI
ncbi:MAG TPA: hypothetical protein VHY08_17820 [Bacillota bacterium]|nr:hypothetical protein [Bacillota bacterium]